MRAVRADKQLLKRVMGIISKLGGANAFTTRAASDFRTDLPHVRSAGPNVEVSYVHFVTYLFPNVAVYSCHQGDVK